MNHLHQPMYSLEAEQAVIGGVLIDATALDRVRGLLQCGDFYRGDHQAIWRAILILADTNTPFDPVTLAEHLGRTGDLDSVGGISYLGSIAANTPSAANVSHYAAAVADRAKRRKAASVIQEAHDRILNGDGLDGVLSDVHTRIEALAGSATPYATWADAVRGAYDAIGDAEERRRAGGTVGAPFGLPTIDRRTGGLWGARLWVVAARPSIGKTALVLQAALHAASRGHAVGIASLEMTAEELAIRAMAHRYQVNGTRLAFGYDDALDSVRDCGKDGFSGLPLYVDSDTYTLAGIVARISEWRRKHGIAYAIVDHIGLVETERSSMRLVEQLGLVTRTLKKTAKRLGIPIIAVSQLNREVEREKRPPRLSDLRDSGNIEQDADVVLALHCEEVDEEKRQKRVQMGLLKNRAGVRGWIGRDFEFDGSTQTFSELDQGGTG